MSELEEAFLFHLKSHKVDSLFIQEYKFLEGRKFRFDFAYPDEHIAIELEGGIYSKGGHSSISGITRDIEKGNLATLAGWHLYRFTSKMVYDGEAINFVLIVLNSLK